MMPDRYIPWTDLQFILFTHIIIIYYCENAHLLQHRSEHTCASVICYQRDFVAKVMHCTANHAIILKSYNTTVLDAEDLILLSFLA